MAVQVPQFFAAGAHHKHAAARQSAVGEKRGFHSHFRSGLLPIQICILQNLHHKISVDQIATYFGTNRTSLQTKFRDQIGVSVRQYIIKTRIQAACVMLKNTSLAIAEIAERTGFSDETTFVRAFKKQTSLPPGEYRKSFVYPSYL